LTVRLHLDDRPVTAGAQTGFMQFKQGANRMNRTLLGITLIVILSLGLTGCQLETAVAQASQPYSIVSPTTTEIRCEQPQPEDIATCQQWEEEILATTVRIQLSGWLASAETNTATWTRLDTEIGHGTVKDGRTLVTHNHYQMPFDLLAAGRVTGLVSLFTAAGEPILSKADINIVTVVYEDSQTLVLDFQTGTGEGLFDQLGIPSAAFKSWAELPLQPGMEVAQLDWDGIAAYVDWTEIEAVITNDETPKLQLDNFNEVGSSGGGVFRQGAHIANNWQRTTVHETGGTAVLHQFSSAVLNLFLHEKL
jgi:hypothetical protein